MAAAARERLDARMWDDADMSSDSPMSQFPDPHEIVTERLAALGLIIEWSAAMEVTLRNAFCSLVGSKLAAVVAGGQSAAWLIGQCRALTVAHGELTDSARNAIKKALDLCDNANTCRNVLIHGLKFHGPDIDSFVTSRSRLGTHVPTRQSWTTGELREAAMAIANADSSLFAAMQDAVSRELMDIGNALIEDEYRLSWQLRREKARLALAKERGCSAAEISDQETWNWMRESGKQWPE